MRINATVAACTIVVLLLSGARLRAENSIEAARQLYASAEYASALEMLNSLATAEASREDRRAIALYRTLCLLAVGRAAEADRSIEAMISQDPLYRPDPAEIPPRMRTAISDARKRVLPGILHQKYGEAKAAFDKQDFTQAANRFKELLDGLSDPDITTAASQSPLSDLKTLAVGFHELSSKAMAPLPSSSPVAKAIDPGPPLPAAATKMMRIYTAEDLDVVPPQAIRQQIPSYPGRVTAAKSGVLEVVIDRTGSVESAMMRVPVNAQYDRMATAAARSWQYEPARVDGAPVKFLKRIQVTLVPNP